MPIPTFIQNSRVNQVIYQIREDHLVVESRPLLGSFSSYRVPLRSLSADYRPAVTRNYGLLIGPLIMALLCAGAIWGLHRQSVIPQEGLHHLSVHAWLGLAVSLIAAIRGSRRIEYYQFNDHWEKPVLHIIRERAQADECAAFILELVAHIEAAHSGLSPGERRALVSSANPRGPEGFSAAPAKSLWLASLICGAAATVAPWLPHLSRYLPELVFPIVFSLCSAGTIFCAFSFLGKEPRRWLSLPGLILSLIPPVFY